METQLIIETELIILSLGVIIGLIIGYILKSNEKPFVNKILDPKKYMKELLLLEELKSKEIITDGEFTKESQRLKSYFIKTDNG